LEHKPFFAEKMPLGNAIPAHYRYSIHYRHVIEPNTGARSSPGDTLPGALPLVVVIAASWQSDWFHLYVGEDEEEAESIGIDQDSGA